MPFNVTGQPALSVCTGFGAGGLPVGMQIDGPLGSDSNLLAIGMGTVLLLRGGGLSGAWLMLLGWFGLGASRNQRQLLALQQTLNELKVRDAAGRRFRVLEAAGRLRELSQMRVSQASEVDQGDWLLVCDRGRWQGFIDDKPLQQLPVQRWDTDSIGDHIQPLCSLPSIHDDAPRWQAVIQLDESSSNRLLVLSPAGLPCGTLERPELAEAVLAKLGVKLPAAILEAARREGVYPLGMGLAPVALLLVRSSPESVGWRPDGTDRAEP
jgi:hypothetical protein